MIDDADVAHASIRTALEGEGWQVAEDADAGVALDLAVADRPAQVP